VGQGGALVYDEGKNPNGLFSVLKSNRSLVSPGDIITVTLELRNEENESKTITPSAVTVTSTNGANAALNSRPDTSTLTLAANASGTFTWTFLATVGTVPGGLASPASFARFRWSTQAGLSFTGSAANGEVEDYQVRFTPAANLALTKSASSDPLIAGQLLAYTLTVTNNGPADAADVTISDDPLPAGLSNIQHSLDKGLTWVDGWTGSHTLATLPGSIPENTFDLLIRGVTSMWLCGTLSNTASVSAATVDPDLSDN